MIMQNTLICVYVCFSQIYFTKLLPSRNNKSKMPIQRDADYQTRPIFDNPSKCTSIVWNHFGFYLNDETEMVDKTYSICKICKCKVRYSGNTTNMSNHLMKHHPEITAGDPRYPGPPRNAYFAAQGVYPSHKGAHRDSQPSVKTEPPDEEDFDQDEDADPQPSHSAASTSMTSSGNRVRVARSESSDQSGGVGRAPGKKSEAIANFLIKDMLPVSTVEDPGFKSLIQTLDCNYKPPDEDYFQKYIHGVKYNILRQKVMDLVSKASHASVCPEVWIHADSSRYLTLRLQYIDKEWKYCSHVLDTIKVSGILRENELSLALKDLSNTWGIPTFVMTVPSRSFGHLDCTKVSHITAVVNCIGEYTETVKTSIWFFFIFRLTNRPGTKVGKEGKKLKMF